MPLESLPWSSILQTVPILCVAMSNYSTFCDAPAVQKPPALFRALSVGLYVD